MQTQMDASSRGNFARPELLLGHQAQAGAETSRERVQGLHAREQRKRAQVLESGRRRRGASDNSYGVYRSPLDEALETYETVDGLRSEAHNDVQTLANGEASASAELAVSASMSLCDQLVFIRNYFGDFETSGGQEIDTALTNALVGYTENTEVNFRTWDSGNSQYDNEQTAYEVAEFNPNLEPLNLSVLANDFSKDMSHVENAKSNSGLYIYGDYRYAQWNGILFGRSLYDYSHATPGRPNEYFAGVNQAADTALEEYLETN